MTYGYWAVLLLVAVESVGIPVPGEAMLLSAAVYGGVTHQLNIVIVIAAAAVGAIMGDNVGYLLGREGGYRLLHHYGRYVWLDERRLRLGEYLFRRHGGKVVFFGRFVAVLRMWAAFLAGAHRMPWRPFLLCNAAGGIVWAALMGLGGYALGHNVERVRGPLGLTITIVATLVTIVVLRYLRRHEQRLSDEAERTLPRRHPLMAGPPPESV